MNKIIGMILSAIFGLFFMAAGIAGVALEYKTPPVHTTHLFGFLFLLLLGATLVPWVGALIFGRLKDGIELAGPYFPTFGRRASQGEVAVAPTHAATPAPHVDRGEGSEVGADVMPGEGPS